MTLQRTPAVHRLLPLVAMVVVACGCAGVSPVEPVETLSADASAVGSDPIPATAQSMASERSAGSTESADVDDEDVEDVDEVEAELTDPVDRGVLAAIFGAGACSGPFSRIKVYRDPDGRAGVLLYLGDPGRCTHPPGAYHSPTGELLEDLPFEVLEPGSERAEHFRELHERYRAGLEEAETVFSCRMTDTCSSAADDR